MADISVRRGTHRGALVLVLAALAAPAAAQQQSETEFASWRVPGWSFTPGLAIGTVRDSNVALADSGEFGGAESDSLFGIEPFGSLEFYSPRTEFSAGYRGYLRRYLDIDQLNGFDQRVSAVLRHQITRRLSFFATESYLDVPSTDEVLLNGLPFLRTGARTNTIATGISARLTKLTDLSTRYELTWVDFDNEGVELTGGWINNVSSDVMRRIGPRVAAGGEYSFRFATVNEGTRSITFQDAGGRITLQLAQQTSLAFSGGMSHLSDPSFNETRTAPYFRASLTHRMRDATVGTTYERSFVPAFGFGGANENQEVTGFIYMPIPTNRAYVNGWVSWRHGIPYLASALEADTVYARSTVGYAVARWFRVEGSYTFSRQDSAVTGGEIDRHRLGAQVVISQPMRIR